MRLALFNKTGQPVKLGKTSNVGQITRRPILCSNKPRGDPDKNTW